MTKQEGERMKAAIDRTTIPEEMSALYVLANATDMIAHAVFNRIRNIYKMHGYTIRENDRLKGVEEYCKYIKYATEYFQREIEPQITGATFDTGGPRGYDGFQDDSRELAQLSLLYIDRTARSNDAYAEVMRVLRSLPSGGILTDKDIEKYNR